MVLSNLGIFHTVIGVIALVAAVIGFIKKGKIDLSKPAGKVYFYLTAITSLTALGLSNMVDLIQDIFLRFLLWF